MNVLKNSTRYVLGFVLLGAGIGCGPIWDEWDYGAGGYGGSSSPSSDDEDNEDILFVAGSGETLVLEYNSLTFTAKLNWRDGNFYFAPDLDGNISGNKIVCVATVSEWDFEGDCFRDEHVCHFRFTETYTDSEDKDAYWLTSTTCKTAASVGPFLVPLEAPLCGEDPFPECPEEDLFPSGPVYEADDEEPAGEEDGEGEEDENGDDASEENEDDEAESTPMQPSIPSTPALPSFRGVS